MPFFVVCRSNQHLSLWVPAQGRDDDLCMTRSRVTNLTDSIFKQSAMRGHNFAISPNAFFARYSFISRPPNRGRRECRAPEACRFARRGKSPAPGRKDPGGCIADGSACGLPIFLDETAYLFLEAIKLCSVRHNRESNETIHSNEYPQTKTNLSSGPKLGRGT